MPWQASNWLSKSIAYIKEDNKPRKGPILWLSQRGKVIPKCKFRRGQIPLVENTCREIELPGLALNIWAWFLTEQGLELVSEH